MLAALLAPAGWAAAPAPAHDANVGWGMFETYCTGCHNTEDWAGGVAFDAMVEGDIGENAAVFEKVVRKLRSQQMPPGGSLTPAEVDCIEEWIGGL